MYPFIVKRRHTYQARGASATQGTSGTVETLGQRELRQIRQRIVALDGTIRGYETILQRKMSELDKALRQRTSIHWILQDMDQQEKKDTAPVGWYDFFFKNRETIVEKERKKRRLIERITVRRVQNTKLEEIASNIRILESEKTVWRTNIESAQRTLVEEKRKLEAKEMAEDAKQERARQEEEKETARRAELAKQREKQEAVRRAALIREMERKRMAQETQEAERQRWAAEAERVQNEMERRRREALYEKICKAKEEQGVGGEKTNERAECLMKSKDEKSPAATVARSPVAERRKRARQNAGRKAETTAQARKAPCLHGGWWPKIMGQFVCERCSSRTYRYAFRCPSCSVVACANCRNAMKG